jgi:branched-chain amino acid transport system ATP-binding protein
VGKSTTLKAISGLLHVEEGEVTDGGIEWNGVRIDKKNAEAIGRLALSRPWKAGGSSNT